MKRSVTVEIAGQKFTLKTDAEDGYVRSLASFVTEKMDEVRKGARAVATQSIAILAAMNIADDLLHARRSEEDFRRQVKEKSQVLLEILDKEARP